MGNVGCRYAWNDDIPELRYQSRNQTSLFRTWRPSRVVARRHCCRVRCSWGAAGAMRTVAIQPASVSEIGFEFAGTAGVCWQETAAMDETCSVRNISRNRRPVHQSRTDNPDTGWDQKSERISMYIWHHGVSRPRCETGRTRTYLAMDYVSSWHAAHDSGHCRARLGHLSSAAVEDAGRPRVR